MSERDSSFAGRIPELYEQHLVPMMFAPFAEAMAALVARHAPGTVLELAAGTGVVTRALSAELPDTAIVATDLNPAMLEVAAKRGASAKVSWQPCDAQALPFEDGRFDAVVCQFGVMFLPDRPKAFREAYRVLRGGGHYFFSVWNRIETHPVEEEINRVASSLLGRPAFLGRVPHGTFDAALLQRELKQAGLHQSRVENLKLTFRAPSAEQVATAYYFGTPLHNELEEAAPGTAQEAAELAIGPLTKRFGSGPIEAPMEALVFVAGPV